MNNDPHSDPRPMTEQTEAPALSDEAQRQIGRKLRLLDEVVRGRAHPGQIRRICCGHRRGKGIEAEMTGKPR